MASPRWMADEMVGRLARYLRMVGCDTVYVRGLTDEEVVLAARSEQRIVLTRDRLLAARADRALLLTSPHLADQWRAVREAYPEVPNDVRFDRCTECNGTLAAAAKPAGPTAADGVPWDRTASGLRILRCESCGHVYWEGTHTAAVRARIAAWESEGRR